VGNLLISSAAVARSTKNSASEVDQRANMARGHERMKCGEQGKGGKTYLFQASIRFHG
jgi:hypothetical protein